jgi:hypothetical protein
LVCPCYSLQLKPVRLPLAKKATPPPDKNFLTIPPDYRKFPASRPAFSFHGSHAQAPHAASCCCFSPSIPGRRCPGGQTWTRPSPQDQFR